ncbi:cell division protein FtsQ [Agrobacterium rosae]|uniref:Cell division protein FtsQ n=2 Tax=Agrobacterium rosae TaxID=1972867 RepID=A0AAE5VPY7_9HYPH|nr:cell division protein FtsQ/DivIB [Agrobacterium rosae]KAA3520190.1 cell division protein FtsQ/DivIB [Agrobacterium rosae]MQB48987.1 cell division protein FtsQ/DivIB [Agrobacterium rosae]POO52215.1 cell division protein FtsQ [Agrobacterium rosae]POO57785.1 cell division protein FtsQ [Agrobacterium rosae]
MDGGGRIVFAMNSKKSAAKKRGQSASGSAEERMVLPRPLRKGFRFGVSLATGRVHIPAHTGTLATLAFFSAIGLYGMSLGGHTDVVAQATTSAAGFAIEDVKVSGNIQTSEIDVFQLLGLDGATSLIALDVNAARKKLTELPWVEDVDVRKIYPKTIEVRLKERQAFGIWQHGTELSLIEKSGSVIAPLRDNKYAGLPLFVGRDAETGAAGFVDELADWPEIRNRVRAYVRIAGRRWDLHLDNGIVVKLPEENVPKALQLLSRMDMEEKVLSRDVAAVDLRLSDRTTVQLTEGAAERRQKAVEARSKALKTAEKNT